MSNHLKENSNSFFPSLEREISIFWENLNLNILLLEKGKKNSKKFSFYDGPPGTNGKPHIGHMLQSSLKDLYIRYKLMQGFSCYYKIGWDTHGLPIELTAQKKLNLFSKKEIENYGIEKFIDYCREIVFLYKAEWLSAIKRIGRVHNPDYFYATYTSDYIQSVWAILKKAWEKKLLYQSYKITAYCPKLGTSLSNQEVALGYQEVEDLTLYVKFKILSSDIFPENSYFLVWTTTPWTLIGNMILALSDKINYIQVKSNDEFYVFAENLFEKFVHKKIIDKNASIIKRISGELLKNISYKPLWDFFTHYKEKNPYLYTTILDSFVSEEEGTGIVHLAFYGEEDFRIIKKYNLEGIQHVDLNGYFINDCGSYKGRSFDEENLDQEIKKDLKSKNLLLSSEKIKHKYPFNYKTGTKLIYYAKKAWFLKTSSFKDLMIQLNKNVNWKPPHIKEGRFGKWLENNVDWNISRERYWGTPLPIWECLSCFHQICFSSFDEIKEYAKNQMDSKIDLHIPDIDSFLLNCSHCGSEMKRDPSVLDCWFDAASMPWAQFSYPHKENSRQEFKQKHPADFICEGLDQTRGWFYGLLALSTFLVEKIPYKNVLCTDLLLDYQGQKMSKSKNNIIAPQEIFDQFGADAMRWFFIQNTLGKPIRFSYSHLEETVKVTLIPLWNIYQFFKIYATIENYQFDHQRINSFDSFSQDIDRWILSEIESLVKNVCDSLDDYKASDSTAFISKFIDSLSNWYIRRNRKRFWKKGQDQDKKDAFDCLFIVFYKLCQILSPYIPFLTEFFYQNLFHSFSKDFLKEKSIHLSSFPVFNEKAQDLDLQNGMKKVREISHLGNALRNQLKIKIRQPLASLNIKCRDSLDIALLENYSYLIQEELNVKKIIFEKGFEKFLDSFNVKPNLKLLGKKIGNLIPKLFKALSELSSEEIFEIQKNEFWNWVHENKIIRIELNELLFLKKDSQENINQQASDHYILEYNTHLSNELLKEGLSREFINKVQNIRKSMNFKIDDRIKIFYACTDSSKDFFMDAIHLFQKNIKKETLAREINYHSFSDGSDSFYQVNDFSVSIKIEKYE